MPDWERPKAFPKRPAFLTADFVDGAEGEKTASNLRLRRKIV
jgi:hypothetical protein